MGILSWQLMSVTEYLKNRDLSLTEIDEPSDPVNYKCFNTGGVETAVGEFLYGLVRMMRPDNIFETGTHMGISSAYMAQALKDNEKGLLTTIEIDPQHIKTSRNRWQVLGLTDYVVCDKEFSIEYDVEYDVDLMFLDSEPEYRFKELVRFFDRLKPGGYVFIHDLHRHMHQIPNEEHGFAWPYGKIPKGLLQFVNTGQLRPFHFTTPRGLTGFYKVSPGDHIWQEE